MPNQSSPPLIPSPSITRVGPFWLGKGLTEAFKNSRQQGFIQLQATLARVAKASDRGMSSAELNKMLFTGDILGVGENAGLLEEPTHKVLGAISDADTDEKIDDTLDVIHQILSCVLSLAEGGFAGILLDQAFEMLKMAINFLETLLESHDVPLLPTPLLVHYMLAINCSGKDQPISLPPMSGSNLRLKLSPPTTLKTLPGAPRYFEKPGQRGSWKEGHAAILYIYDNLFESSAGANRTAKFAPPAKGGGFVEMANRGKSGKQMSTNISINIGNQRLETSIEMEDFINQRPLESSNWKMTQDKKQDVSLKVANIIADPSTLALGAGLSTIENPVISGQTYGVLLFT